MIRWIEINVASYWDPNRYIPHNGLFEGLISDDFLLLHSWGENLPKGFSFLAKSIDRVDVSKIEQKHILIREQYMFFIDNQINIGGVARFLWDVEMMNKIVYLPYFRELPTHTKSIHIDCWSVLQDYVCEYFEYEFYFDFDIHKKNKTDKQSIINILRRQISLDDLV
jgi:hypothetical protein